MISNKNKIVDESFGVIAEAGCRSFVQSSWHRPHADHFVVDETIFLLECNNDEHTVEQGVAAVDDDVD